MRTSGSQMRSVLEVATTLVARPTLGRGLQQQRHCKLSPVRRREEEEEGRLAGVNTSQRLRASTLEEWVASPIEVPSELVALVVDVDVERAEPVGRAMEPLLAQHRSEELQQRVPVVEGV